MPRLVRYRAGDDVQRRLSRSGHGKAGGRNPGHVQMRNLLSIKTGNPQVDLLSEGMGSWLPDMDLNHDKQIQSLLCYRYTIGQTSASTVNRLNKESRLEV